MRALSAAVRYNDEHSWVELLMPQCVLRAPARGGRKHQKAVAAYTRIGYTVGKKVNGPLELQAPHFPDRPGHGHRREAGPSCEPGTTALMEGMVCPGVHGLCHTGYFAALQALHPSKPAPLTPPLSELPVPPSFAPEAIWKALQPLLNPHLDPVDYVSNISGRHLPLLQLLLFRDYFWPAQAGVGVKAGAEAAVHTVRGWLARHAHTAGKVAVKLNFRNAFNSLDRSVMLQEARAHFPALARWASWLPSAHSPSIW